MTRTFRKTLKDHAGPGCDVVREFMVGESEITQRDNGILMGSITVGPEYIQNWLNDLPKVGYLEIRVLPLNGFEEVQSPANNPPTSGEKSG